MKYEVTSECGAKAVINSADPYKIGEKVRFMVADINKVVVFTVTAVLCKSH